MIRSLIARFGAAAVTAAATVVSTAASLALVVVLDLLVKGHIERLDVLIGIVIPVLVAPVMIGGFARLSQQLDRAERQMREAAAQDPLTGVLNRRQFLAVAEREWERATRYGRPQAILLLDVDGFKAGNDRYGHICGDETLQRLSDICRACLRRVDVFGRFGGDEFMALLPETDEAGGLLIADRIRRTLEMTAIRTEREAVRVTVSIGAAARREGETFDELLRDADAALYAAKSLGRNRVQGAGAGIAAAGSEDLGL